MKILRPALSGFALLAVLLAMPCNPFLEAAGQASALDKTFVGKVSQGGMYEVEASKVAEQKAMSQDVKDVAATEVHDHELVNRKLAKIAADSGVDVAGQLNTTFQQRLDALKSVSGAKFDSSYLQDMQEIHDKDEKLFAKEAIEGSGEFKPFAAETDRVVKRHIGALNVK